MARKYQKLTKARCSMCGKVHEGENAGHAVSGCISSHLHPHKGIMATNPLQIPYKSPTNPLQIPYKSPTNECSGGDGVAVERQEKVVDWWDRQLNPGSPETSQNSPVVINNYPTVPTTTYQQPVQQYRAVPVGSPVTEVVRSVFPNINPSYLLLGGAFLVGVILFAIMNDSANSRVRSANQNGEVANQGGGHSTLALVAPPVLMLLVELLKASRQTRTEIKGWSDIRRGKL